MRKLQHADATLACELTQREHQITTLLSAGLSNKEIARRLHLTEGTVKPHVHKILQKARVKNRTALAARFQAIRQAKRASGIAVDAWKMAAECARAIEASNELTRRALLASLQELWLELGNKEVLLGEQQVLKETQVLCTLHEQFLGVKSHSECTEMAPGRPAHCVPRCRLKPLRRA
jgi:DNA-binding CsgD family transcriptional regulator